MPQNSKVLLEDLLRLKRAEQPGPEFWKNFEAELRQKQLTALVKKRRWWHELPALFTRRVYLPAGAAAVAAFTLVAVRYTAPSRTAQIPNSASEIAVAEGSVEVLATTEVPASALIQSGRAEEAFAATPVSTRVSSATADFPEAPVVPAYRETEAKSPRAGVASLARLTQTESSLLEPMLDSRLNSPVRMQAAADAQTEVAAMTAASASKYRLIARYVDRSLSPVPAAPALVRERLARQLGDDLNDGISRIGVAGNRVSLKF